MSTRDKVRWLLFLKPDEEPTIEQLWKIIERYDAELERVRDRASAPPLHRVGGCCSEHPGANRGCCPESTSREL